MKFATLASIVICAAVGVHAQEGSATIQPVPDPSITPLPIPSSVSVPGGTSIISVSIISEPDVSISGTSVSTIATPSGSASIPGSGSLSSFAPSVSETAEPEEPGSALAITTGFTGPIIAAIGGLFAALL